MEFTAVKPDELRLVWATVREGIERIKRKTAEPFLPEDVYLALMQARAILFMHEQAFLVLEPENYFGIKSLNVWLAVNFGAKGLLPAGIEWLKEHAKQNGFSKITFSSPRKGWGKHFTVSKITYEARL